LTVHALPSVLQLLLSAAHLPPVQVPLQHWPFPVHAVPSEPHAGNPQAPLLQSPLQHAPFDAHLLPREMHPPSLPNGLPESPMVTPPLLLPPLLPAPLLLLLLDVASPASPPLPAPPLLLLPQATKAVPETTPPKTATHTSNAGRRSNMLWNVQASFQ
jgi:hypothetical protein